MFKIIIMSKINFNEILDSVVPLHTIKPHNHFHIANVVSTVELLNIGETICLESLSLLYNGMIKYQPKVFAAAILRVKDPIAVTTCLVYRNGKLVVVGSKSRHHAIMVCQMYRQMIEKSVGVYTNKEGKLCNSDLIGRTLFKNWTIRNIIGNDILEHKPNLKKLVEVIPEITNWNPDLFPGLVLHVWLSPKKDCHCIIKKDDGRCDCTVGALIFDSKRFLINGCKDMKACQRARKIIADLFYEESLQDHSVYDKSINNFQKRKQKIIEAGEIDFSIMKSKKETKQETSIDVILKGVKIIHQRIDKNDMDMEPLQKARKYNQTENIKFLSAILENSPLSM